MAQLIIDSNFQAGDSSNDEIEYANDDVLNYRGYFQGERDEDEGPKYYEHGAHFPYFYLYQKLQIILQAQEEEENKKQKGKQPDKVATIGICIHNNHLSRNRRNNLADQFLNSDIPKNEVKNDSESSKESQNTSSIIVKQKMCESTSDNKNNSKEMINYYTTFASKLKMNKHLNFSKKSVGEEENTKHLNKNQTVNLSNDKINNHSTSKNKNNINSNSFKIQSKSRIRSKELSSSYYRNKTKSKNIYQSNNQTTTKIQARLIANSLNNILTGYKNKRNGNINSGLHPQPTKITQKFSPPNKIKRIQQNKNNSKNNSRFGSINFVRDNSNNSRIKSANDKNNNIKTKDILSSITQISSHKSRNINEFNSNLLATKNNQQENPHLTQQNPSKKNHEFSSIEHNKISNKTVSSSTFFKGKKINKDFLNQKFPFKDQPNKKPEKGINSRNLNDNNKNWKTSLNLKVNLYDKSNDKILNELKKSILSSSLFNKPITNIKKNQCNVIKQSGKKKNNMQFNVPQTRNAVKSQVRNPKMSSFTQILNNKNSSNSINININISNTNKIFFNKIINANSRCVNSKKEGTVTKNKDNKANIISTSSLSRSNNSNTLISQGNSNTGKDNNSKGFISKQGSNSLNSKSKSKQKVSKSKAKTINVKFQKIN